MREIRIITENGKTVIYIDGVRLDGVHSFSVDYLKGAPVQVSLVADIGKDEQREKCCTSTSDSSEKIITIFGNKVCNIKLLQNSIRKIVPIMAMLKSVKLLGNPTTAFSIIGKRTLFFKILAVFIEYLKRIQCLL